MNDPEEARRQAHLARRGAKGPSDPSQRTFALLKRDGSQWWPHPEGGDRGMWCPKGWEPDWMINHPVIDIKPFDSRV